MAQEIIPILEVRVVRRRGKLVGARPEDQAFDVPNIEACRRIRSRALGGGPGSTVGCSRRSRRRLHQSFAEVGFPDAVHEVRGEVGIVGPDQPAKERASNVAGVIEPGATRGLRWERLAGTRVREPSEVGIVHVNLAETRERRPTLPHLAPFQEGPYVPRRSSSVPYLTWAKTLVKPGSPARPTVRGVLVALRSRFVHRGTPRPSIPPSAWSESIRRSPAASRDPATPLSILGLEASGETPSSRSHDRPTPSGSALQALRAQHTFDDPVIRLRCGQCACGTSHATPWSASSGAPPEGRCRMRSCRIARGPQSGMPGMTEQFLDLPLTFVH